MGIFILRPCGRQIMRDHLNLNRCIRRFYTRRSVAVPGSSKSDLIFETGHLARFASGSVVLSQGNNAVLATVVGKKPDNNGRASFAHLTVDFRQSASALGRIPTNYLRRELRQTDEDILTSRAIDRSIRPLFPRGYGGETQVLCKPLSLEDDSDGLILGLNAASAALAVSEIPWDGPVAAVRVGIVHDKIVINPKRSELKESTLNMVVTGSRDGKRIVMIEMDGKETTQETLIECFRVALAAIEEIAKTIISMDEEAGKDKWELEECESNEELMKEVLNLCSERLYYILTDVRHDKMSRDKNIADLANDVVTSLPEEYAGEVREVYSELVKKTLRDLVLETNIRCDGRGLTDFRPIDIKVDVYRRLHGSALFQRGQTQVFGTVTFDAPSAAFHPDSISQLLGSQQRKMFMLHYEFPPFATNEISAPRNANRRELGHGALAEKALKHVVPEQFPYSVRLACQVLESNGSSSMASVCVGSLALMDAGVPLKAPAAGVAIGLVTNEDQTEHKILTDILGIEDYAGDMDFKIAGTSNGITAMQFDLKLPGLSLELLEEAIARGRKGIEHVLSLMNKAQSATRSEFKSSVPVLETMSLPMFKRHILFRSGGYNVKLIEAETGVRVNIEDESNVSLTAPNRTKLDEAKEIMERLFADGAEPELTFGGLYKAEIVEILEHGVMVRLKKGMRPTFMSNSNLDLRKVAHASSLNLEVGSVITVQYLGRDTNTGQHRICRKTLQSTAIPMQNLNR